MSQPDHGVLEDLVRRLGEEGATAEAVASAGRERFRLLEEELVEFARREPKHKCVFRRA